MTFTILANISAIRYPGLAKFLFCENFGSAVL